MPDILVILIVVGCVALFRLFSPKRSGGVAGPSTPRKFGFLLILTVLDAILWGRSTDAGFDHWLGLGIIIWIGIYLAVLYARLYRKVPPPASGHLGDLPPDTAVQPTAGGGSVPAGYDY